MKLKLAEDLGLPAHEAKLKTKPGPKPRPGRYCVHCGASIKRIGKHVRCQSCAAKQRLRKPRMSREERLRKRRALAGKWRAKNREKIRAYFRAYDAAHKEERKARYAKKADQWRARARRRNAMPDMQAKHKAWRDAHRTQRNTARRAWDLKHPERAKAIELRHRERRRHKKRAADRSYRQQKPEIYKASIARAKAAKPELYKAIAVQSSLARRVRRKQQVVERVSLKRIRARDRDICHLCGQVVEKATFDHLIPVVRGGAHAEWNLMVAHDRCNKSRGTKQILPDETKAAAEAYIARRCAEVAA